MRPFRTSPGSLRMRTPPIRFAVLTCLSVLVAGCSREPAPPANPPAAAAADTSWPAFVDRFIEARMESDPYFAVNAGRHEFDGKMPDWNRAALDAEVAQTRAFLIELGGFDPAKLNAQRRFEREYLQWVMDAQLFWMTSAEQPFTNPAWYLERLDPSMYLTREYAPLPQRLAGFLGYARAVP